MPPAASWIETEQALSAQLAVWMALLLAVSALHKAFTWSRSLGVTQRFGSVNPVIAPIALAGVIAWEALAASLLPLPIHRAAGAAMAAVLWALYLVLIARAIIGKRADQDCGCSWVASTAPLGAFQLARNAVMIGIATGVAALSMAGSAMPGGAAALEPSQLLGGVALLALFMALDHVLAFDSTRRGGFI